MTIRQLIEEGAGILRREGVAEARLDSRLLLQHALGLDHAGLVSRMSDDADMPSARLWHSMIARRAGGEPVSRIIGLRSFFGLEFKIGPAVLDPRPDTELLVERVLADYGDDAPFEFADIGTGSGAIAIAILANRSRARASGCDISADALQIAMENARRNAVSSRFAAVESDFFERIDGRFDLFVANPPYIGSKDIVLLDREVRDHDPLLALDGGADGLDAYRRILAGGAGILKEGGKAYLEMGAGQCSQIEAIAVSSGWKTLGVHKDLAGIERVMTLGLRPA